MTWLDMSTLDWPFPKRYRGSVKEVLFTSVGDLGLRHSLCLWNQFLGGCRWYLTAWEEARTRVGWLGRGLCVLGKYLEVVTRGKSTLSFRSLLFSCTCLPSQSARAGIAQRGNLPRIWSSSVSWKLEPQEQLMQVSPSPELHHGGKGRTILFPDRFTCSYYLCFVLNYENFMLYCFNQQWNMPLWIVSWYSVCCI